MTSTELENIFKWLIDNIFRNDNVMFNENISFVYNDEPFNLADVIASLANLLYKEVYGDPYDYFFHWANKIGADVEEHFFEHIMRG